MNPRKVERAGANDPSGAWRWASRGFVPFWSFPALTCVLIGAVFCPVGVSFAKEKDAKGLPAADSGSARDLSVARKMIRGGNYSQSIPRLLKVLEMAPNTREGADARYFLGVAYEAIQDFRSAQKQFNSYLTMKPDGEYVAEAKSRLERIGGTLEERYVSPDELETRLERAQKNAAAAPGEVGPQLDLADALWLSGDYAEAGKVYAKILAQWPKLADDMVVRQRMRRDADGVWTALDPKAAVLEAADRDPLVIYNTSSFRSGREEGYSRSFQAQKYNVTGEAMNRGRTTLENVELVVTIYGFGGKVYETKTVRLGRLATGEARPFSTVFENFENIENVERYQVKGIFTR